MQVDHIAWVIKLSKLCNMRCSYCYEWPDLADPTRISPDLLDKIFHAVRALHLTRSARLPSQARVESNIVFATMP